MNVKKSVLENGLEIWSSHIKGSLNLHMNVAVKAGSRDDFDDATGLAHYLEHMMFKGNSEIGSLDWDRERPLLQAISECYEEYCMIPMDDVKRRAEVYARIDQLNQQCAPWIHVGEYDELCNLIGIKGRNALTLMDRTVFTEEIPFSSLERWMFLKATQFKEVVLRMFHAELEVVYQEYNASKRLVGDETMRLLFPDHPYGTRNVIGDPIHLKNPRPKRVMEFFNRYYVASNMAIVCSGDVDHDQLVALVQQYWGSFPTVPAPVKTKFPLLPVISKITTMSSPDPASMSVTWRIDDTSLESYVKTMIVKTIMANIVQGMTTELLIQNGAADMVATQEALILCVWMEPLGNQSLSHLHDLLQAKMQNLIWGNVLQNIYGMMKRNSRFKNRSAVSRTQMMVQMFAHDRSIDFCHKVQQAIDTERFTKQDIYEWMSVHLIPKNSTTIFKVVGDGPPMQPIVSPIITAVSSSTVSSRFKDKLLQIPEGQLEPDYTLLMVDPVKITHLFCEDNLFHMRIVYPLGHELLPYLPLALEVFDKLDTMWGPMGVIMNRYAELGSTRSIGISESTKFLTLDVCGPFENILPTMVLMNTDLLGRIPNDAIWQKTKAVMASIFQDEKDASDRVEVAMDQYALFGSGSPFRQTRAMFQHDPGCAHLLQTFGMALHNPIAIFLEAPSVPFSCRSFAFMRRNPSISQVPYWLPCIIPQRTEWYFYHQKDLLQATMACSIILPPTSFDIDVAVVGTLWSDWFASILFHAIREKRGLAYHVDTHLSNNPYGNPVHSIKMTTKVQPDVLETTIKVMDDIIANPPDDLDVVKHLMTSLTFKIKSLRPMHSTMFDHSLNHAHLGLSKYFYGIIYDLLTQKTLSEIFTMIMDFHKKYVVGAPKTYTVIVNKDVLPFSIAQKGRWLTKTEIF